MHEALSGRFVDPRLVTTHLHLREGDVVADFGAGSGHFLPPLSHAVGKSGKVYASEIQKPLIDALDKKIQDEHLSNVAVVWGDIEEMNGTNISDNELDVAIVSNTLFQVNDKSGLFKEVGRTLRPGGKLIVIDWTNSFAGIGPHPEHVVTEDQARTFAEAEGFTYDRSFPAGEHHYGLAFRKA